MVKAHVVQTIWGTRGHNSLGAVCSPTVWTLVAHTPSISIMLSDNFILNQPGTESSDTQCEAWAFWRNQIWNSLHSRFLHSVAQNRSIIWLAFSTQQHFNISTPILCGAFFATETIHASPSTTLIFIWHFADFRRKLTRQSKSVCL